MTPFIVLMLGLLAVSAWLLKGAPPRAAGDAVGKLAYLEGIRGVAALMVIVFHFIMVFYPAMMTGRAGESHYPLETLLATTPLFGLYSGTFFVAMFFVLSGFVLSYRFLLTPQREIVFSSACRRYLRLAYPVLFTTAFYAALMWGGMLSGAACDRLALITRSPYIVQLFQYTPTLAGMLHDILFRLFFILYENKYNYALWTMGFEFIGSLLLYGCLLLCGKHPLRWLGYVAYTALVVVLFKAPQLTAFLIGMMLCDLYVHGRLARLNHPVIKGTLLAAGLYLVGYNVNLTPAQVAGGAYGWLTASLALTQSLFFPGWLTVIAGAALLLALATQSRTLQKSFSSPMGLFLGKISFSLYLIHYSVLLTLGINAFRYALPLYGYHPAVLLSFALCLPVMIALAWLIYQVVDRPAHLLGKRFYEQGVQKIIRTLGQAASTRRAAGLPLAFRPTSGIQEETSLG